MSYLALVLVLTAALLHASWNLVLKTSRDRLTAAGVQLAISAFVSFPFLLFWSLPLSALPYLVASSMFHLGYVITLVGAYDRADFSMVYPVARGTAPILITVGAAVALDEVPGVRGLIAIGLVAAGIVFIAAWQNGSGLLWALATAVFIAGYMMVDGVAVRKLDSSIGYTLAAFIGFAITLVPVVLWRRTAAEITLTIREEGWSHLLAALAGVLGYVLVLAAARFAPLGLVSAFRETSVVFGAIGGWILLKEDLGRRRFLGAFLIAVGLLTLLIRV